MKKVLIQGATQGTGEWLVSAVHFRLEHSWTFGEDDSHNKRMVNNFSDKYSFLEDIF